MTALQRVEALLSGYRPVDPRQARFRGRMLELAGRGARALARDNYEPGHFTASAFVLSPDGGSLLLILHRKLGLWLQPGGHLEPHDADPIAAARREVREEVGIDDLALLRDTLFDADIHGIPAHGAPAHEHFDLRFLFRAPTLACRAASDARDARRVPLAEVAAAGTDDSVRRAAELVIHTAHR